MRKDYEETKEAAKLREQTNDDASSGKSRKSDGKKYQNRNARRHESRKRKDYSGKKANDIAWHAKSQQLLNDCASVPWSYSTGRALRRAHLGNTNLVKDGYLVVPGIFALKTVLSPGVSTSPSDAINIAAQALYTDIRSQLKSANAYDSSDVMIYMCEMAEIKAMIAFIRRILGTPLNFSFMNSFFPDALIKAQGIDPTGIKNKYAEYRSRANQLIAKASQIWWPKGFDFVTRAEWEYSNYYSEGESIKDQIYMFTPGLFRKFTYDETRDYAGMLTPCIKFDFASLHTMDEVLAALSDMIDSVVGDTDFQNIAGDLFNRYGASGVETFTLIPDTYIINPALSFEVLEQMQNAKCLAAVKSAFDGLSLNTPSPIFCVAQDETNNILLINNLMSIQSSDTHFKRQMLVDLFDPIFTVDKDPSVDKTMLITRCANALTKATITEGADGLVTFDIELDIAMEFVVGVEFYWLTETGVLQRFSTPTSYSFGANQACIMSPYHYHPIMQYLDATGSGVSPYPLLLGSIDTYATINPEQLKDMNRVDLMSLFAVPNVGSVSK